MDRPTRSRGRAPARGEALEPRTLLAFFMVTTVEDGGPGSLRQAIIDANATAEADVVDLRVARGSVFRPRSPLPVVTAALTLRDSESGPISLEIDGSDAGPAADGLVFGEGAGGSEIDNIAITGFGGSGVVTSARQTPNFPGLTLLRCNIGTDPSGTVARGNGRGAPASAGLKILPGAGVVMGRTGDFGTPVPGGTIAHNFGDGVQISPTSGAVLNGVNVNDNAGHGIIVNGPDSAVTVSGPEIPSFPNRLTSQIVRNGFGGVRLGPGTRNSYIKSATIGGNGGTGGIYIKDSPGNRIFSSGISDGLTIEGAAAAQNAIRACVISGDRWGTGLFAGAHDNSFAGLAVSLRQPGTPTIIGSARGTPLVISGAGTNSNLFVNTRIGGSAGNGVEISDGASSNAFRTLLGNEQTVISGNARNGVLISGAGTLHNSFTWVRIYNNAAMAIDLVTPPGGPEGRNPNDPLDADSGANELLNHPVISSAVLAADGVTTVRGSVDTRPNTTIDVQLFADEPPPSGEFGPGGPQAGRILAIVTVTTDAAGHADFTASVVPSENIPGLRPGQFVTALASVRLAGDTSELSPAVRVAAAPQVAQTYVNGSRWAQRFRDYLARSYLGSASRGYALFPDSAQEPTTVNWVNVDEVSIRFTEDVRVQRDHLRVNGERVGSYGLADFRYDPTTFTATWRLTRAFPFDRVSLGLDSGPGGVAAVDDGAALDGDGDGQAGGAFSRQIVVVPGDIEQDGRVNALDLSAVRRSLNGDVDASDPNTPPFYFYGHDVDGSGRIDALDLTALRRAMAVQPQTFAGGPITAALLGDRGVGET